MSRGFLIVDNFLPDADAYREEVLRLPFYDIKFGDETYKRIHPRSFDEFKSLLQGACGRLVEQDYTILRLNYEGELPNNAIHSDNECGGGYAAVLYLNKPEHCQGGTAFWRHKATGLTEFDPAAIRRMGKSPARTLAQLSGDWNRAEAWEQTGLAKMAFNRLVVYPAIHFHSRFPFPAFGTTPQNGRFIWCSFFRCL